MNSKQIASLVSEANELDQQIAASTALLKQKKAILIEQAMLKLREESDIKDALHSGASYTFKSEDGSAAALINFPGKKLLTSFWIYKGKAYAYGEEKEIICLGNLDKTVDGPENFGKLFAKFFKPCKAFREVVKIILPKTAEKLLALLEQNNSPRVSFKTKETPLGSPDDVRLPRSERRRTTITVD